MIEGVRYLAVYLSISQQKANAVPSRSTPLPPLASAPLASEVNWRVAGVVKTDGAKVVAIQGESKP